jgi:PPOX class probable F420-dependent enzyme
MGVNQRTTVIMTDEEISSFIDMNRTATLATQGPEGFPHLIAMWFGLVDGRICFETKAKSQKVVNLRRDPRVTCLIEAGDTYDQLRGVAVEGVAHVVEDEEDEVYWAAARSLFERYYGSVVEETWPQVQRMMHNRIVAWIEPRRIRSWDHRKLDLPSMPVAGSTAPKT